ncbi:transcription factor bHLH81 [Morus notabilis]|uniref:transcription factor bHLH81 n=1 Tax=Morus notabilis TaxID=981085 RepID=UPI000CED6DB8|nr:transcription factor bHLH81 [Morus notabilis]XP_024021065.1 transcription factor bHLH81 [Morus notabilis]XP_024021066.1 transcription factor bHLH81 [Morus notabilis]
MQPAPGGSSGGGGGVSRTGLSRFRSAPATWLEALLEDEEEDPLKPNQCLTQLLTENSSSAATTRIASVNPFGTTSSPAAADLSSFDAAGFLRQNSSPADFLGDGLFSGFDAGPASSAFDLAAPGNLSSGSKRARDVEAAQQFSSPKLSNPIKLEQGGQASGLIDMEMEKLLDDSVPCRVRAKRGCATHPRSIAERVRRTRISDRIRKLQELVPNMDKQTNTADMLEEAVEYVKYLQRQIQELSEHQSRCKCTSTNEE